MYRLNRYSKCIAHAFVSKWMQRTFRWTYVPKIMEKNLGRLNYILPIIQIFRGHFGYLKKTSQYQLIDFKMTFSVLRFQYIIQCKRDKHHKQNIIVSFNHRSN